MAVAALSAAVIGAALAGSHQPERQTLRPAPGATPMQKQMLEQVVLQQEPGLYGKQP